MRYLKCPWCAPLIETNPQCHVCGGYGVVREEKPERSDKEPECKGVGKPVRNLKGSDDGEAMKHAGLRLVPSNN